MGFSQDRDASPYRSKTEWCLSYESSGVQMLNLNSSDIPRQIGLQVLDERTDGDFVAIVVNGRYWTKLPWL